MRNPLVRTAHNGDLLVHYDHGTDEARWTSWHSAADRLTIEWTEYDVRNGSVTRYDRALTRLAFSGLRRLDLFRIGLWFMRLSLGKG